MGLVFAANLSGVGFGKSKTGKILQFNSDLSNMKPKWKLKKKVILSEQTREKESDAMLHYAEWVG